MLFVCHPKILHKHCFQFLLGVKMAPRDTENNAYAKFWGDKQRALWYVVVFLEWSIAIITDRFTYYQIIQINLLIDSQASFGDHVMVFCIIL